jgi:hypothetical protein
MSVYGGEEEGGGDDQEVIYIFLDQGRNISGIGCWLVDLERWEMRCYFGEVDVTVFG